MAATVASLLARKSWHAERKRLYEILCGCGLRDVVKWNQLCFMHDGANVAIIQAMKDLVAVAFFKGAILPDPQGVLRSPGKHSRHGRRMEFTSLAEIDRGEKALRALVGEAIAAQDQGRRVPDDENKMPDPPAELLARFARDPEFRRAFAGLTPGRQRGYLIHFTDAAQSATRERRIARHEPRILQGKGMHDR